MTPDARKVFDPQKVADLAIRIREAECDVAKRQTLKEIAESELNSAQCRLSNLRSDLTRAVEGQLDVSLLGQTR